MTGESFFLDIAKISITIAGFAGVVGALRHPREKNWKPNEIYGLKLMLEHSLVGVIAGLLPTVLFFYFANEASVWLWMSALLALFFAYELIINIVRIRHASAANAPPRSFYLLISTFIVPTVAFLYFQIQNVVSWHSPLPSAAGVLWLVMAACIQFMHFLHVEQSNLA